MKTFLLFTASLLMYSSGFSQNVGIGTSSPLARLHVMDSSIVFSAAGEASITPGKTPIDGEGRRMMWYADKAAFRAGYVTTDQWDKWNVGNYSFATGFNSIASGYASMSMGNLTEATGSVSTTLGNHTIASGAVSTAVGDYTNATGDFSTAMGHGTDATGFASTAMGYETSASGLSSTSMGESTSASGFYSTAMGIGTLASSYNSTAMGGGTTASGYGSAAMGHFTMAKAFGSLSIGVLNDNSDSPDEFTPEPGDRLFQIGNGSDEFSRSNAFTILRNGNVGIGMTTPGFRLSFDPSLGDKISLWSNSSNSYGFGIQSSLLQIHTDVADADIAFGFGSSTSLTERMRIINIGEMGLEIYGRIMLKNGTLPIDSDYSPGIWLQNSDNSGTLGFIGTQNNQNLGFYGGSGGWGFIYDAINSRVGIGIEDPDYPLEVTGNSVTTASFMNTSSAGGVGVNSGCINTPGVGWGVAGYGGEIGVSGFADLIGTGTRQGIFGYGSNGTNNYGVYANAFAGTNTYGVYASGYNGTGSNWAGYFVGDVYTSGSYQGSDRKLKNDIMPLNGAIAMINQLNPSVYTYRTSEYKQMHLPDGLHYGLIADEVQQVIPGAVKKTVQPAQYEYHHGNEGKMLSDEVEFFAVNYIEMIPILIAAVKEQQQQIADQQMEIKELKSLLENYIKE